MKKSYQSKKEKFSDKNLITITNRTSKRSLTFKSYFRRIILNFIEEKREEFDIVETVILSCTLIEGVVKEKLREINPALLVDNINTKEIAVLSNKQKKLVKKVKEKEMFIKTSNLKTLIDRYIQFYDISKYQGGINGLIKIRNNIIHTSDDYEINQLYFETIISKYVFPFLELNISVSKTLWNNFQRIASTIDDKYFYNIMKEIVRHQKQADRMSIAEKEKREKIKFVDEFDEFARARDLCCPSCGYHSTTIVDGVDVDYEGPGEYSSTGYSYSECSVCGLRLESSEYENMIDHSGEFFDDEEADEWFEGIQANDYSDITDYIDL